MTNDELIEAFKRSRRGQDCWVITQLRYQRDGFFVELGAFDGVTRSDTHLLEKAFGWRGVCIEPSKAYDDLVKNRSCTCVRALVGEREGEECEFVWARRKSGVFFEGGNESVARKRSTATTMRTTTLTTVLDEVGAPSVFEYLALDVEGFEPQVLRGLNFSKYKPLLVTVERRFTKETRTLLSDAGYTLDVEFKDDDGFIHEGLQR